MTTTTSLKSKLTIKNTVRNKAIYQLHKKLFKLDMPFEVYDYFIKRFHEEAILNMLEGSTLYLTPSLGELYIIIEECRMHIKGEDTHRTTYPIDPVATKKYSTGSGKRKIYDLSFEKFPFFRWKFRSFKNRNIYYFRPNKNTNKTLYEYARSRLRGY